MEVHRLRTKSAKNGETGLFLSQLEIMQLRENLEKTLTKFPLYTIHIRGVLSKTGHGLPTDGEWTDGDE